MQRIDRLLVEALPKDEGSRIRTLVAAIAERGEAMPPEAFKDAVMRAVRSLTDKRAFDDAIIDIVFYEE